jgi:hypothetical protein
LGIIDNMSIATSFNAPTAKGRPKVIKFRDGINVAARYFVYKLSEATDRQPMEGATLYGLGESAASISRAVERGWVVLQNAKAKPLERKAALTDEERQLARVPSRPLRGVLFRKCRQAQGYQHSGVTEAAQHS